jgi:hypothetical protein
MKTSMCRWPRKPQRKPGPSATLDSRLTNTLPSLSVSSSIAESRRSKPSWLRGYTPAAGALHCRQRDAHPEGVLLASLTASAWQVTYAQRIKASTGACACVHYPTCATGSRTREHHRLRRPEPRQRLRPRLVVVPRVADARRLDALEPRHHISNLPRAQLPRRHHVRREHPQLEHLEHVASRVRAQLVARAHGAVLDDHKHHRAAELVHVRIEQQQPERRRGVALRRRHVRDNCLLDRIDAKAAFCGAVDAGGRGQVKGSLDLACDTLRLRRGQVDLVDDGDDREVELKRHEEVCHGLRLHGAAAALRRAPLHFVARTHERRPVQGSTLPHGRPQPNV